MARQWGPEYRLILTTDSGSRLINPVMPIDWYALRKANTIAPFGMTLPYTLDRKLFTVANPKEYLMWVMYKPVGGTMSLFNVYFVTGYERTHNPMPNGQAVLFGFDANILAYRRVVAGFKGSTEARLTEEADDMMKTLFTNALSDANDPTPTAGTRAWSDLTVGEKVTKGPSLTLDLEFEDLLTFSGGGAFKKIINASRTAGTDLFFEVQPNEVTENSINFIFNTFTTQIGQDLSDEITLSIANSSIQNASVRYDYSKAKNYIYAGGKGQDVYRNIKQAYDADEYLRGKYTRSEGFKDSPGVDDDSLQDEADSELQARKRAITVKGDLVDTKQLRFGRDYKFGDLIKARMWGDQFTAMVNSVKIGKQSNGKPILQVKADYRL